VKFLVIFCFEVYVAVWVVRVEGVVKEKGQRIFMCQQVEKYSFECRLPDNNIYNNTVIIVNSHGVLDAWCKYTYVILFHIHFYKLTRKFFDSVFAFAFVYIYHFKDIMTVIEKWIVPVVFGNINVLGFVAD